MYYTGGNMYAVMTSLQTCEPSVYNHLISQNMKPEFFAFRWITLLLSQEFQLPGNVIFCLPFLGLLIQIIVIAKWATL